MASPKEKPKTLKKETTIQTDFAFGKINYTLMLAGIGLIILGFMLMAGGKSDDPKIFNPEVFSFRRITLAPIVVMAGFILNIYAIVKKAKD
ncbi:MAG: DUF3098 domain-containing protein [Bacteroidota bacterium]